MLVSPLFPLSRRLSTEEEGTGEAKMLMLGFSAECCECCFEIC